MDIGVLIARVVFGLLLVAHGSQKLFGWFGGGGVAGSIGFFETLGFRPGRPFVVATGLAEFGAGILLGLGLMQPAAAAAIVAVMFVAITTVHWGKGLLSPNGIELPLIYLAVACALACTGPGAYSLDAVLGLQAWWTAPVIAAALATGLLGGLASLSLRRTDVAVPKVGALREHRSGRVQ